MVLNHTHTHTHIYIYNLFLYKCLSVGHRPDILSLDPGFSDASSMQHGRKFSDGFVGILDLFGIELSEVVC